MELTEINGAKVLSLSEDELKKLVGELEPLPPATDQASLDEFRRLAEWDWVHVGSGQRLHAVEELDAIDQNTFVQTGVGKTACGLKSKMVIPGIRSRMSTIRCATCCQVVGMPRGRQSPKNIDTCRPVVKRRLSVLGLVPRGTV